jgi:hypothetical protein
MKTAAVLPASGIGDALLMMIASHHLLQSGYAVTTFHSHLPELASWFPDQFFKRSLNEEECVEQLASFDLVIAENDNSSKIRTLSRAFQQGKIKKLSIFYPTYSLPKHGPAYSCDQVFDPNKTMAQNIGNAIGALLNLSHSSSENGITPPPSLRYRSHPQRIAIHPTSSSPSKNWSREKYLKLALRLKEKGFDPHFCVGPDERYAWGSAGYPLPDFPNLSSLAAFVFESGFHIGNDSLLGHLASNLKIPTLTLADDEKRMRLWRPGWGLGQVILPPQWIPNPRILRWKKNHWQCFISTRKVLKAFEEMRALFDE